jgi:protein-S-isoprenylcysteine O-methyltransferase Ste14
MAMKALLFGYALAAYVFFFGVLAYLVGFVTDTLVPKTVDTGTIGPIWSSVAINVLLVLLFAVQHTIMARPRFKVWWTKYVPKPIERSTFVVIASAILALLMWQWRPLPAVIWHVQSRGAAFALQGVSLFGWLLALYSTFLINHFDLFGLRQAWLHLRSKPYTHPRFVERSAYKHVRHPLMVGFLIGFWATPHMTVGHLLLAGLITAYVLFGTRVEERDLVQMLGDDYLAYRQRTPRFVPRIRRKGMKTKVTADSVAPPVACPSVSSESRS